MGFWRFVDSGGAAFLAATFSPFLVILSVLVASFAAYTALAVVTRILATPSPKGRIAWLALGSTAMGAGIWAMHFSGMLAYQLPLPTNYHVGWTLASIVPAVIGSALALHAMSRERITGLRLTLAGLVVAVGIGTMHYTGMEAVRVDAEMRYDLGFFALSIAVAFALSTIALYTRFMFLVGRRTLWRRLGGAVLMGCAVSGMHYTAMAAVHFVPTGAHGVSSTGLSPFRLALLLVVIVFFVTGLALIGTIVDQRITEALAQARDSEQRHRTMLAAMADGVLTVGSAGMVEATNAAAEAMLGYSQGTLVGKPLVGLFEFGGDLTNPGRGDDPMALIRALVLKPADAYAKRRDGTTFPAELRVYQLTVGQRTLVDVLLTDMSVARAGELERKRLVTALQQADDAIFITDQAGTIEYVNRAFERITGYQRAEVLRKNPRMLKSGDHEPELYRELWSTISTGEVWTGTLRNRRKDGELVEVAQTISPIRDEAGAITHFVAVCRDVTEQKALELQLRQAQKLEAIGQLAAGIAHEINSPIQFIGDNARFLQSAFRDLLAVLTSLREVHAVARSVAVCRAQSQAADAEIERADADFLIPEIPRAIAESLEGIHRVARIVRAMKEFSHPGSGKSLVDLNHAIDNTITVATNEWKYVADIETDFDAGLPPVPCAAGEINQVVLNLIVNAAHAIEGAPGTMTEKGRITITTRREGAHAVIRVADTGSGIPEAARPKVFEPFFTTKEIGKGTGQGLTLAHNVVTRKHGGTLDFETEIGKGTTFTVRLPLEPVLEPVA